MSLFIENSSQEIKKITSFIINTLSNANKEEVVIAVSGGIDSALSLELLSKTLSLKNIYPIFLPFAKQDMSDAKLLATYLNIPESNWQEVNIERIVNEVAKLQEIKSEDHLRLGNIMARSRMIVVYDLAKKLNALVCGTENKSEKYLGYFTRFGDEASDFEPIVHLYKTQVRQLVKQLDLPKVFLSKDPSAELWQDQTDEQELGFSYGVADMVIESVIINGEDLKEFSKKSNVELIIVKKVVDRVNSVKFKHQVPYSLY